MSPYPEWLHVFAWVYLSISFLCATIIVADERRRPQKLMIMNFVWPITATYFGPVALWGYFRSGLTMTKKHYEQLQREVQEELRVESANRQVISGQPDQSGPTGEQIAVADTHCGAGCTLGDISAEWWVFAAGLTFAGGEFQTRLVVDFLLAWAFGILFQYFTLVPMRGLSFGEGLFQAMRADTLAIVAFEIGLFSWMTLSYYALFPNLHLKPTQAIFWFMMQIGMVLGFFTAYPVNIFLIRKGWKERMPQRRSEIKKKIREQMLSQEAA